MRRAFHLYELRITLEAAAMLRIVYDGERKRFSHYFVLSFHDGQDIT